MIKKGFRFHNRATQQAGTVTALGKRADKVAVVYYKWDIAGAILCMTEEAFRKVMRLRPEPNSVIRTAPVQGHQAPHVRKGRQVVNPYVKEANNCKLMDVWCWLYEKINY